MSVKENTSSKSFDTVVIGAGAAGLFCAITAAKRGLSVLVIEKSEKIGEKIRISGGSRCNFTNINATHSNYISENEHFMKSAFAQFTPGDFIELVERHKIKYHEKKLGQLFCDESSKLIINMLLNECKEAGVKIQTNCNVKSIDGKFTINTNLGDYNSKSLVIATGGLSIPQLGATDFGYKLAKEHDLKVNEPIPALVPFTMDKGFLAKYGALSGSSIDSVVESNGTSFRENILFTHKGLSGPAILQISSYWDKGGEIKINLLPEIDLYSALIKAKENPETRKKSLKNILKNYLPEQFTDTWFSHNINKRAENKKPKPLAEYSNSELEEISSKLQNWKLEPTGTEGFSKAEVTRGGICTSELSSKTMESKKVSGLYFIGEVVDVTGHLGGYNFQWAWSSAYVAGQNC